MMFVQRFVESFRVGDKKAIINGANNKIANTSNSSGPIFMPPISPVFRKFFSTSGSKLPNVMTTKKATA